MVLFEVFGLDFNMSALISFLIGIMTGFIIMFMIYIYAVIRNFNKKAKIKLSKDDVDQHEVLMLIKDTQKQFKDKEQRKELGYFKHLTSLSIELSKDISKKFFPKSKYPYLEVTIDEALMIGHYSIDRISEILDVRILRMFKSMTIKQITVLIDTKKTIENTKIVKGAKKTGAYKVYQAAMNALNVINPVYWFRKLVLDNAVNIIMEKMGQQAISIIGEETYKVYGKKLFVDTDDEETINKLYEELEKELKESMEYEEEKGKKRSKN